MPSQAIRKSNLDRQLAAAEALFMSIGDGAFVTDEAGKLSRVNQVALDILGYRKSDLIGKWYPDVIRAESEDGEIIPNLDLPITHAFLAGEPVNARLYYRRKNGSRVAVALTVSPILIDDVPVGAIEVFRDITREVELERAKDEFISLASHQLRTPATGVKQYIGMLLEGYAGKLSADQLELLKRANISNERQIAVINDLLQVARLDAGKVRLELVATDIVSIVQDVIDEQAKKFRDRQQTMEFIAPKSPVIAEIDPQRLRMVIENIVDNAAKYTPEGKGISVTVSAQHSNATISVDDQGVGIHQQDIPKIFNKFSRIHNPMSLLVGGTGLGLYWAKRIVDLHGGQIEVTSQPGSGSRFSIKVPLRSIDAMPAAGEY